MVNILKEDKPAYTPAVPERISFDQYRLLSEAVSKNNDMREQANNFWTTVNVVLISGMAYIKDAKSIDLSHKGTFMWIVLVLGYVLSLTWLSYLARVKRIEEVGTAMLAELESGMSYKIFTRLNGSKPKEGKATLTFSELAVPLVFLFGYIFFTIGLVFFKQEAISPSF
jgi:hypothetical protein